MNLQNQITPTADEQLKADKLRLLYHQSHTAVIYSLISAAIFVGILWPHLPQNHLLEWFGAVLISSLFRFSLFIRYTHKQPNTIEILKWETPYYITLLISSAVWGFGTVLVTHNANFLYQSINFYFVIGMAGAALSVYSAIRYFAISTISLVLGPILCWFIYLNNRTSLLMALACLLFLVSALRATKVLSTTLNHIYTLTHELSEAKDSAELLARTDSLTGLNNRRAFTESAITQMMFCARHHYPVSILLLDLDHFKKVNDTFGHAAGDIALQHIAHLLKQHIRGSDICGRLGGEEFAVLLSNTHADEAIRVAEKIRLAIESNDTQYNEKNIHLTVSIGISSGKQNLDDLLNTADKAMYKAKQAGRNQVMYLATTSV